MKRFIVSIMAMLMLAAGSAAALPTGPTVFSQNVAFPATSQPASLTQTLQTCARYRNHVYEVCSAYIFNSSLAVLVPYYKYVHNGNTALERYVSYRLGSRYTGQANTLMKNRVAHWPAGTMEVGVPTIHISSVHSSLATNTATLVTSETWHVTTQSGRPVYQENNRRHVITMHRVPSYILHKWVVTNIK